jgi:hypothetical protein
MSENMRYWDRISKPPTTVLKPIAAGRLKGKSDINPQWRMQAMTELYGPCGFGWKYSIDKLWMEKGAPVKKEGGTHDEVAAFALVSLFYKEGDQWSEAIPGIGGSMFVEMEKNGPHNSDEAYKMAVTDALSVAMKSVGMAAEIYLGNFDGSKYTGQAQRLTPVAVKQEIDPKDAACVERVKSALKAIYGEDKTSALDKVEDLAGVRNFATLKGDSLKSLAQSLEALVPKSDTPPPKCEQCGLTLTKEGVCPDPDCTPF